MDYNSNIFDAIVSDQQTKFFDKTSPLLRLDLQSPVESHMWNFTVLPHLS